MTNEHPKDRSRVRRYLVLADASAQYPVLEAVPDSPLVIGELPAELDDTHRAVEYLTRESSAAERIRLVSRSGELLLDVDPSHPVEMWGGVSMAKSMAHFLDGSSIVSLRAASLAPVMLLRVHASEDGELQVEVLAASRLRATGATFARVSTFTPESSAPTLIALEAIQHLGKLHESVAVERQDFTKFEKGTEIEVKLNIVTPVSIWELATAISGQIGGPKFPGMIPDLGNEMQRWQSTVDLYEVTAPANQIGYISYQEQPSGRYLKFKRFSKDSLRRQESFRTLNEEFRGGIMEYLQAENPELELNRLPRFTRTRFDINIESTVTGHMFGVLLDEVRVDDGHERLQQVEIEYFRSRVHDGISSTSIDSELHLLAERVGSYLEGLGITSEKTFYSKLSFLKDTEARRKSETSLD